MQKLSNLEVLSLKNEPKSIHETPIGFILEEMAQKKMIFKKPSAYIDYKPAVLKTGNNWHICYYVKNSLGKFVRYRMKLNHIKDLKERNKAAKILIANINERLALGWNPKIKNPYQLSIADAISRFLETKYREVEINSMRSYNSYINVLRNILRKYKIKEDNYLSSFDAEIAALVMREIDCNDRISAQTFNNYLRFFKILFNYFIEENLIQENPFNRIKKKNKKLTKKKRRMLSDDEISTLFDYLSKNNPEYLIICLLCYSCFIRPKEIVNLKCSDIDLKNQTVFVSADIAKNDNDSVRTIPDSIIKYFYILNLKNPNNYVFGSHPYYDFSSGPHKLDSRKISRYWSDFVREGCHFSDDLQFYSLKDTGITNMLSEGVPLSFVKQQADHHSLAMTSVYLQNTKKANEAIKGVDIFGDIDKNI